MKTPESTPINPADFDALIDACHTAFENGEFDEAELHARIDNLRRQKEIQRLVDLSGEVARGQFTPSTKRFNPPQD